MANELAVIESKLLPLKPMFEDLLLPLGIPPMRIIRSVLISCERTTKLLECTTLSVCQAATSFAVLGLEVDGWSGQGYLVPFGKKAQPIVGYMGLATIAARSGMSITGCEVYHGDKFDFQLGTEAYVRHRPAERAREKPAERNKRITQAWAQAEAFNRPPIIEWMPIDDILAIRDNSPAFKGGHDTPWKEPTAFPMMVAKTVRRRLRRGLPMSLYHAAASMEDVHERTGAHTWLHPNKGLVIDGDIAASLGDVAVELVADERKPVEPPQLDQPAYVIHRLDGTQRKVKSIEQWRSDLLYAVGAISSHDNLGRFRDLNSAQMDLYNDRHAEHVAAVIKAIDDKLGQL